MFSHFHLRTRLPNLLRRNPKCRNSASRHLTTTPNPTLLLNSSPSLSVTDSIHCHVIKSGRANDMITSTSFLVSYLRLSDPIAARQVFDAMPHRDTATWNAMLSGLIDNGAIEDAFALFGEMAESSSVGVNSRTLAVLLRVRSGGMLGRCVHGVAWRRLSMGDVFLRNSLLVYYAKCGEIEASERLFAGMRDRDVVSWNAMMSGYVWNGCFREELGVFNEMRKEGVVPDSVTLETALQACGYLERDGVVDGELIHSVVVRLGFNMCIYMGNMLLLMYSRCGMLELVQRQFDVMPVRNVVSWNILTDAYLRAGCFLTALWVFKCMRSMVSELSPEVLVTTFQATKMLGGCLELVGSLHCLALVSGCEYDEFVNSSLVSTYGELGEVAVASKCMDDLVERGIGSVVLWNAMLSVYVHNGYLLEAIRLLQCMQDRCCHMDPVTLVNALCAANQLLNLKLGKAAHAFILRNQLETNVVVATSLLEFYSRCGLLKEACWLFSNMASKNVVTWNTMIFCCLQNGHPRTSLKVFHLMHQHHGVVVDATTVVGAIESIAQRGHVKEGKYIYEYAVNAGLHNHEFVANSLIPMCIKFGNLRRAKTVFEDVANRNVITWNTMISACCDYGPADMAITVFYLMKSSNIVPDSVTFLSVLSACAHLSSLSCSMWVHGIICKAGHGSDVIVGTSLIDVYAKCGDIIKARLIFDNIDSRTTITWNSMIHGYGMHGNLMEVDTLFYEMKRLNSIPDTITFLILISACSHVGHVQKGLRYFNLMIEAYHLSPRHEHYSCFIDLLSRKGLIEQAYNFLQKSPVNPGRSGWGSLLGACRVQHNIEIGSLMSESMFKLYNLDFEYCVLLSNMLSEAGRWNDAYAIRRKLQVMGYKKEQGKSMVEMCL